MDAHLVIEPFLFDPQIRGHHLVLQTNFNQLRKLQTKPNGYTFSIVNDGSYQTIIVT